MKITKLVIKHLSTIAVFYLITVTILRSNGIIIQNWDTLLLPILIALSFILIAVLGFVLMCLLITKFRF